MKKLGVALAAVAVALLLAAAFVVVSSLPGRSGTRPVAGLRAAVRIETDSHGVPAIHAASADDAFFGLGWAHARDRLWQMELQRRIGAGRLAEVLGPKLVATDRFLRTIGFRRAAEAELASLSPGARTTVSSYRAGVNAFLARGSGFPVEFRILRMSPAPFDDVDCLVWAKLMAWDLGGNASAEIRRARIESLLGPERAADLFPAAPPAPTILRDGEWRRRPGPLAASAAGRSSLAAAARPADWERLGESFALLDALGFGGETLGSNSWVLSGSRTRSGRPMLANDPHLGLRAPSIWYLARLIAPGLSVEGATLPGLPGVVIGRNERIAWGLTNLEPDVQDLYVERPDPADRGRYLWQGRSLAFDRRTEVIRVRGGPDVRLEVRSTVHGPVVTDVLAGADRLRRPRGAAMDRARHRATGPEKRSWRSTGPTDWTSFLAGVALLHCPAQNFVYADVDGHIGYTASGAIPIRPRADGRLPVSGDGADDWTGFDPVLRAPPGSRSAARLRRHRQQPRRVGRVSPSVLARLGRAVPGAPDRGPDPRRASAVRRRRPSDSARPGVLPGARRSPSPPRHETVRRREPEGARPPARLDGRVFPRVRSRGDLRGLVRGALRDARGRAEGARGRGGALAVPHQGAGGRLALVRRRPDAAPRDVRGLQDGDPLARRSRT